MKDIVFCIDKISTHILTLIKLENERHFFLYKYNKYSCFYTKYRESGRVKDIVSYMSWHKFNIREHDNIQSNLFVNNKHLTSIQKKVGYFFKTLSKINYNFFCPLMLIFCLHCFNLKSLNSV